MVHLIDSQGKTPPFYRFTPGRNAQEALQITWQGDRAEGGELSSPGLMPPPPASSWGKTPVRGVSDRTESVHGGGHSRSLSRMCMALAGIYTAGIVAAAPLQALPATLDTMAGADGDPVATLASPPSEHYGSVPGGLIKTSHRAEAGKGKIYQQGEASWYGPGFHGRKTANGERFNQEALTAAHRKLPLGTRIHVRNLDNGTTVNLRINDRGPYAGGRILDVSKAAARELGMLQSGTATVQIRILH